MGSSHEKVEAIPVVPANKAKTGVIQQSEAVIAVKVPKPKSLLFDFILFQFCS